MVHPHTKEAYAEFLASDFWKNLSWEKRRSSGFRCERCGLVFAPHKTQAHHIRYPQDWYQTKMEDLQCLCELCHIMAHPPKPSELKQIVVNRPPPMPAVRPMIHHPGKKHHKRRHHHHKKHQHKKHQQETGKGDSRKVRKEKQRLRYLEGLRRGCAFTRSVELRAQIVTVGGRLVYQVKQFS